MTFIYFILILSTIVFIHELGHMLVAKYFNVYVAEFALGFGPVLFKKQGEETQYSLRAIPLGGFNRMIESEEDNEKSEVKVPIERTFYGVSAWKRICILIAGPIFNLVLAFIVYMALFCGYSEIYEYPDTTINTVQIDTPAYEAGLKAGDIIKRIDFEDGDHVVPKDWYDVEVYCSIHNDASLRTLTIQRGDEEIKISLNPVYNEESSEYMMGIVSNVGEYVYKNIFERLAFGFSYTVSFIKMYASTIINLFKGIGLQNVGGTIEIYKVTEEAASYGLESLISLTATLSISVGLMNLIPIPTFDGGRILLSLIEIIIGRRLNPKVEAAILNVSAIIIIALFALITLKDLISLF